MTELTSWLSAGVDDTLPCSARMYDYLLGGGHNFAVDREMIDKLLAVAPMLGRLAMLNRAFVRRAVLTLVESGIRQFLDIGSCIPTIGNVHEVAQQADPDSRVLYVDNDPAAVAHSEFALAGNDRATVIQADLCDPGAVLDHPKTQQMLDFDAPVGLLMCKVVHLVADTDDPVKLLACYREALVPGSYLALSHLNNDVKTGGMAAIVTLMKDSRSPIFPRTREAIADLFTGFELLEPGLVSTAEWRPRSRVDVGDGAAVTDPVLAGVGVRY